jgi:hypothetical protein
MLINLIIALNNKQTEQTDAHCEDSCSYAFFWRVHEVIMTSVMLLGSVVQ